MVITAPTKIAINNYMSKAFKNKGNAGYLYIKRMLEVEYEEYKKYNYINLITLKQSMKKANIGVTYCACQRAVNHFLHIEGVETTNFNDFMIGALEEIIVSDIDGKIIEEENKGEMF